MQQLLRHRIVEDLHDLGVVHAACLPGPPTLRFMAAAAVLYVKDLDAMRVFYERCFGMSRAADGPGEFCVLTNGEWELTLVAVADAVRAALVIADPPARRTETTIKLAFDVLQLRERLAE